MEIPRPIRALRHLDRLPEVWRCVRQSRDWPALVAAYLKLRPLRYPYEYRTPFGDVLTLESFGDLVTAWILFYRNEYRIDPACRTIIDAGANIGAFSLLAARRAPEARIIALEPFPETRARLERTIARNGLSERVAVRPWALWSHEGTQYFQPEPGVPTQSFGIHREEPDPARAVAVETVSLATLLGREGLERVDLLKMDIEGAEHEVFHAAPPEALARIRAVAIEYHQNGPKQALFDAICRSRLELAEDRVIISWGPTGVGVAHFVEPSVP